MLWEQVLFSEKLKQNYDYTVPHWYLQGQKKDEIYGYSGREKYCFCAHAHRYDSQRKDRLGIELFF